MVTITGKGGIPVYARADLDNADVDESERTLKGFVS
jgi:hypothetical protein